MTTKGSGACKIDGVQLGEVGVQVDPSTASALLSSRYALVNSVDGARFGSGTKATDWSEKTLQCLISLLNSMESDICVDVFGGSTDGGVVEQRDPTDGVPGF